ncbi:hypothetical protein AAMO2058_001010600 [Amorphochlora amoebiformis]
MHVRAYISSWDSKEIHGSQILLQHRENKIASSVQVNRCPWYCDLIGLLDMASSLERNYNYGTEYFDGHSSIISSQCLTSFKPIRGRPTWSSWLSIGDGHTLCSIYRVASSFLLPMDPRTSILGPYLEWVGKRMGLSDTRCMLITRVPCVIRPPSNTTVTNHCRAWRASSVVLLLYTLCFSHGPHWREGVYYGRRGRFSALCGGRSQRGWGEWDTSDNERGDKRRLSPSPDMKAGESDFDGWGDEYTSRVENVELKHVLKDHIESERSLSTSEEDFLQTISMHRRKRFTMMNEPKSVFRMAATLRTEAKAAESKGKLVEASRLYSIASVWAQGLIGDNVTSYPTDDFAQESPEALWATVRLECAESLYKASETSKDVLYQERLRSRSVQESRLTVNALRTMLLSSEKNASVTMKTLLAEALYQKAKIEFERVLSIPEITIQDCRAALELVPGDPKIKRLQELAENRSSLIKEAETTMHSLSNLSISQTPTPKSIKVSSGSEKSEFFQNFEQHSEKFLGDLEHSEKSLSDLEEGGGVRKEEEAESGTTGLNMWKSSESDHQRNTDEEYFFEKSSGEESDFVVSNDVSPKDESQRAAMIRESIRNLRIVMSRDECNQNTPPIPSYSRNLSDLQTRGPSEKLETRGRSEDLRTCGPSENLQTRVPSEGDADTSDVSWRKSVDKIKSKALQSRTPKETSSHQSKLLATFDHLAPGLFESPAISENIEVAPTPIEVAPTPLSGVTSQRDKTETKPETVKVGGETDAKRYLSQRSLDILFAPGSFDANATIDPWKKSREISEKSREISERSREMVERSREMSERSPESLRDSHGVFERQGGRRGVRFDLGEGEEVERKLRDRLGGMAGFEKWDEALKDISSEDASNARIRREKIFEHSQRGREMGLGMPRDQFEDDLKRQEEGLFRDLKMERKVREREYRGYMEEMDNAQSLYSEGKSYEKSQHWMDAIAYLRASAWVELPREVGRRNARCLLYCQTLLGAGSACQNMEKHSPAQQLFSEVISLSRKYSKRSRLKLDTDPYDDQLAMEIPGFEGNTRGSKNAVERESRDARLGVYSDPVLDALGKRIGKNTSGSLGDTLRSLQNELGKNNKLASDPPQNPNTSETLTREALASEIFRELREIDNRGIPGSVPGIPGVVPGLPGFSGGGEEEDEEGFRRAFRTMEAKALTRRAGTGLKSGMIPITQVVSDVRVALCLSPAVFNKLGQLANRIEQAKDTLREDSEAGLGAWTRRAENIARDAL